MGILILTVDEEGSSEIFLPTSLLVHSSVLSDELVVTPGTTRGILTMYCRRYVVVCEYFF